MPWKGVTMNEQRQRFLEDYKLNVYTTTDLADRFGISRRTAHKWIDRFEQSGLSGYHELSRRPHSSPSQTDPAIVQQIVDLRVAHPRWGPAILLDLLRKRRPKAHLPSVSTAARILSRNGLVRPRRPHRLLRPRSPILPLRLVHQARHLPRAHPAWPAPAERRPRTHAPHPQAGSHYPSHS